MSLNWIRGLVILGTTLLFSAASMALPSQTLQSGQEYRLGLISQVLEDPSQSLTLADVRQQDNWQALTSTNANFGFSRSAFWLRSNVQLASEQLPNSPWYLWIHYSLLDEVTLYRCAVSFDHSAMHDEDCEELGHTGDIIPFTQRIIPHPNAILPIALPDHQPYVLYTRVYTQGTYQLPAVVLDQPALMEQLLLDNLLRGGYFAILLVMGLYNLFIFWTSRDTNYLRYAAFVLSFLLFNMSYDGTGFQLLWPNLPLLNDYALPLFFALNQLFLCLFVVGFLQLKENSPTAYRFYGAMMVVCLLFIIGVAWLPYAFLVIGQNLLSISVTAIALLLGVRFWWQGMPAARLFTIAWLMFIIGFMLANARSLGLIPTNTLTLFSYQIGSFFEIVLLSMALGQRINQLQTQELSARKAMLNSQADAIRYLRNYEDLYQNSLSGQFQLDHNAVIIKSNPAWQAMTGDDQSHHKNNERRAFRDLFAPSDLYPLWQALEQNGHIQGHVAPLLAQGDTSQTPKRLSISIRKGLSGEEAAWIGSAQDVTEKYQQQQALIRVQEEKTDALRQLVMGVAHEMNTPLGNVQLSNSFLADQLSECQFIDNKDALEDAQAHIQIGIERLKELTQLMKQAVLLDNARTQQSIVIRDWFHDWQGGIQALYPDSRIAIHIHTFATHWHCYAFALQEILQQLVDNSHLHNQPENNEVPPLRIDITLREQDDHTLTLHYHDNGIGISTEEQGRVFLPFYTTQRQKARSKGLGLYQTYNLITEVMHGHIHWGEQAGFDLWLTLPATIE